MGVATVAQPPQAAAAGPGGVTAPRLRRLFFAAIVPFMCTLPRAVFVSYLANVLLVGLLLRGPRAH
jgi:hypothetical protein